MLLISSITSFAQFVESGEIEFEVKTNIKKTLGSSPWAEMMKDKLPTFKTAFYKYSFNNQKSIYKFDRWESADMKPDMMTKSEEKSLWYTDFNAQTSIMQKEIFGTAFNVKDSLQQIKWKFTNENRIIAGYNCKKAVGIVMDSIYVFAFYTDEIIIPGGPCTINGLPGMILGMTIPRLYTSWIANTVAASKTSIAINEPATDKNVFNRKKIEETIIEKTKGWSDDKDPDSRKWIEQLIWNVVL